MATYSRHSNGNLVVLTTIAELTNHWHGHAPEEWPLLGSTDWEEDEIIRFEEREDGLWYAERQADDGTWYSCLDQIFTEKELPTVEEETAEEESSDYSGVEISYRIGTNNNFGDCGRLSEQDVVERYARWIQSELESTFPEADITVRTSPSGSWHYSDEIKVTCDEPHSEEDILESVEDVLKRWEFQNVDIEVPELEELQGAPYLYELPSAIVQQIIADEDPFQPDESNEEILEVVEQYLATPDAPLSPMAQIRKRIVESKGVLDYLWNVEMQDYTIGEGRVHEPIARAVLEGLDPRPIYDAWEEVQRLNAKRGELRRIRDEHHAEMLRFRNEAKIAEGKVANDDRLIAQVTEEIVQAVDAHKTQKSPQWQIYRALVAEAKEKERERHYQQILATFDALLEAGDPRVRRSGSGSPVFIAEDGSTVQHPGMGLGAGASHCPTWWFLAEFEERGISLVEVESVD